MLVQGLEAVCNDASVLQVDSEHASKVTLAPRFVSLLLFCNLDVPGSSFFQQFDHRGDLILH